MLNENKTSYYGKLDPVNLVSTHATLVPKPMKSFCHREVDAGIKPNVFTIDDDDLVCTNVVSNKHLIQNYAINSIFYYPH